MGFIKNKKSLDGRLINAILLLSICVLSWFLFYTSFSVKSKYYEIQAEVKDFSECDKNIEEFAALSRFLSKYIHQFFVSQDSKYMEEYLFEIENLKKLEKSVKIFESLHFGDETDLLLNVAFQKSDKLIKTEFYILKLIYTTLNISENRINSQINKIELLPEHQNLSKSQTLEIARQIIVSYDYENTRKEFNQIIQKVKSMYLENYLKHSEIRENSIEKTFNAQIIYVIVLIIICIFLYFFMMIFVFVPLINGIKHIEKGEKLKIIGTSEIQKISQVYNTHYEKNVETVSALKHKAEHDSLTGLINRESFKNIKNAFKNSNEELAFLIIDIDYFKEINDSFGHIKGDEVLARIAKLLETSFRESDYVARVGGDEFSVIMTKFGSDPQTIIKRKIDELNHHLQNLEDGLPSISLSVGVAFSQNGFNEELIKQADAALYKVKKGGRCNCSFSGE